MPEWLIKDVQVVNTDGVSTCDVLIRRGRFEQIAPSLSPPFRVTEIHGKGKFLFPGIIDLHVHFRTPGLTSKGDFTSEGRAALAGGVTQVYDMPNTLPPITSRNILAEKQRLAQQSSPLPIRSYIALTNNNADECLRAIEEGSAAGIKVFLGSTTGNLLLTNFQALEKVMANTVAPILVHSEDERIIRRQASIVRGKYGSSPPFTVHPMIRPPEACIQSTQFVVELGHQYRAPLHILHLSTADEVGYLRNVKPNYPELTVETCPQYLWFTDDDFATLQWRIKCNPAIKSSTHRAALRQALRDGVIDTIGSDHAPHTLAEKQQSYWKAPSGMPMVGHTFSVLFTLAKQGIISVSDMATLLSYHPARRMGLASVGAIREGYRADCFLAIDQPYRVSRSNILYKCKWSPLEGTILHGQVSHTWVNGRLMFHRTTSTIDFTSCFTDSSLS